jgi:ring-1,2-phenylacetyl-CoA epoxidase subunit PaaE
MIFHHLTIKQVTKVTSKAVEILFEIPQSLKEDFTHGAGQYLTLQATIEGKEVRRAYSLSSAPHEKNPKVVIKAVEKGVFSNYAMTLRAGDLLQVAAPEGLFIHKTSDAAQNYLMIAAGSGITPITAIINDILTQEPNSKIALIYGNQSVAQTIYYEPFNDLKDQYGDRFFLKYCFSREERDEALFGRVSKSNLNFFLKQVVGDLAFAKAYLCGPEEMIAMATENLIEKDLLAKENIKFELFSTKENDIEITEDSHLTELVVILDDETHTLTVKRSDNLLEVMIKNDIDAPYSCQGGICSSCICQIEEGTAQMAKNAILTDKEVASGLSLACQAYATSAKVVLNFDEV